MQNKKVTVFAHRGDFGGDIPENSIAAFRSAIEKNIGIELDVRLTRDKIPVVFHDKTLKRMCGDRRKISKLTLAELEKLRLSDSEQKIPTLAEVLELINGKVPLMVETKLSKRFPCFHGLERKIIPLLAEYKGELMIQSFNRWSVKFLKKKLPSVMCGILSGKKYGEPKGFDFVSYKMNGITEAKIKKLREKYPLLLGWGESSDKEKFLDGIIK